LYNLVHTKEYLFTDMVNKYALLFLYQQKAECIIWLNIILQQILDEIICYCETKVILQYYVAGIGAIVIKLNHSSYLSLGQQVEGLLYTPLQVS
jgi:hypothetical protein